MGCHQSHRCSGKIKPFIKHAHACTQTYRSATSESQLGFQTGQGSTYVYMHNKGPFFPSSTYSFIFSSEAVSTGSCFHKTYLITSTLSSTKSNRIFLKATGLEMSQGCRVLLLIDPNQDGYSPPQFCSESE